MPMLGDETYVVGQVTVVLSRVGIGFWRKWVGRVYIRSYVKPIHTTESYVSKNEVIEDIVRVIGVGFNQWVRQPTDGKV